MQIQYAEEWYPLVGVYTDYCRSADVVLLIWLWLRRRAEEEAAPAVRIEITTPPHPTEAPVPVAEPAPPAPDDLKRIKGIGPKTRNKLLSALGSISAIRYASIDRLIEVGATRRQANAIYSTLHSENKNAISTGASNAEATAIGNAFVVDD